MNIQLDNDVQVIVLSAALRSHGLALVWRDGFPVIAKEKVPSRPSCQCGKPATVFVGGQALCSLCYLGAGRARG